MYDWKAPAEYKCNEFKTIMVIDDHGTEAELIRMVPLRRTEEDGKYPLLLVGVLADYMEYCTANVLYREANGLWHVSRTATAVISKKQLHQVLKDGVYDLLGLKFELITVEEAEAMDAVEKAGDRVQDGWV